MIPTDLQSKLEAATTRLGAAASNAAVSMRAAQERAMKSLVDACRAAAMAFLKATDTPSREEAKKAKAPKTLPSHAEMAEIVSQLAETMPFVAARDVALAIPGMSKAEARVLFARLCDEGVVRWADQNVHKGCVARVVKSEKFVPAGKASPAPVWLKLISRVTAHAIERWALHHDDVTPEAILAAWTHGLVLDNGVVSELTGEVRRAEIPNNEYRMAPDYRGILVGAREFKTLSIRTYLRMHPAQEEWLRATYPDAFTTTAS